MAYCFSKHTSSSRQKKTSSISPVGILVILQKKSERIIASKKFLVFKKLLNFVHTQGEQLMGREERKGGEIVEMGLYKKLRMGYPNTC